MPSPVLVKKAHFSFTTAYQADFVFFYLWYIYDIRTLYCTPSIRPFVDSNAYMKKLHDSSIDVLKSIACFLLFPSPHYLFILHIPNHLSNRSSTSRITCKPLTHPFLHFTTPPWSTTTLNITVNLYQPCWKTSCRNIPHTHRNTETHPRPRPALRQPRTTIEMPSKKSENNSAAFEMWRALKEARIEWRTNIFGWKSRYSRMRTESSNSSQRWMLSPKSSRPLLANRGRLVRIRSPIPPTARHGLEMLFDVLLAPRLNCLLSFCFPYFLSTLSTAHCVDIIALPRLPLLYNTTYLLLIKFFYMAHFESRPSPRIIRF